MKRALAVLLLLAACSSEKPAATTTTAAQQTKTPPPPNAQQARERIASAPELAEFEFTNAAVSLPVSGARLNAVTRNTAQQLAGAGWLEMDQASGDLTLSDKARNDKRFLLRENGLLDIVPLAKKEMGDVTAVRANPDGTAAADFTWRWIPNEVGASLKSGLEHDRFAATHNATATFIWDGTSWTVLKIDAR